MTAWDLDFGKQLGGRDIALALRSRAQMLAICGPSGCGKTSLLHMIAGILPPDFGHIRLGDKTLYDAANGVNLAPAQRNIAMLFQDSRLFPHMRVAANLDFAERSAPGRTPLASRDELIEQLDLQPLLGRWPRTLSGGETRRVALARCLLGGGEILLLDEPFISLDSERANAVRALIERVLERTDIPVICVTHEPGYISDLAGKMVTMATENQDIR